MKVISEKNEIHEPMSLGYRLVPTTSAVDNVESLTYLIDSIFDSYENARLFGETMLLYPDKFIQVSEENGYFSRMEDCLQIQSLDIRQILSVVDENKNIIFPEQYSIKVGSISLDSDLDYKELN